MSVDILCLRPEADFTRAGVTPSGALTVAYRAPGDADVPALAKTARAMIIPAVGPRLPASLFEGSSIKLVQVTGAGLDRLDLAALAAMHIAVSNVPGGSNGALAEYTVATAAFLLRRLGWADAEIRAGRYAEARAQLVAENAAGLEGMQVGVVGYGVVGKAVAAAFVRSNGRVSCYDPMMAPGAAGGDNVLRSATLVALLEASDVVTLHVPLLDATRGMLGDAELARMKAGAVLIQASRGAVVDEHALARHIESNHLGGAAVDVYATEPPGIDNPLLALPPAVAHRVLFTPHVAGVTRQASAYLFRTAWQNVERALAPAS
ncbi:MAG: NAD(P)-dependent oxidoreductase [Casimicrobiaceae bacterium]